MSGPILLLLRVLLALALYAFLGLILWMLAQDLSRVSDGLRRGNIPPIRLEVHSRRRPVIERAYAQPEVTIGRDPLADVPIPDEAVSARHALLSFHHGQWWLDDLGSRNGTRLNRHKLGGSTVLTTGDEIQFGRARIVVSFLGLKR